MFGGNLAALSERKARTSNTAKAKVIETSGADESNESNNGKNLSQTKLGSRVLAASKY